MANKMLASWSIDPQCQKAVVFVLSVEDRKFWIARDDATPVYGKTFPPFFENNVTHILQTDCAQMNETIND